MESSPNAKTVTQETGIPRSSSHDGFDLSNTNRRRRNSETDTNVPMRNLKVVDVAALILNKMVRKATR